MKALVVELAKDFKTPKDLSELSAQLTKITVEATLVAEMDKHLVYQTVYHPEASICCLG